MNRFPSLIVFGAMLLAGAEKGFAVLPANVQFKPLFDTASIRFTEPTWFGAYPGIPGSFLVGELAGDIHLLAPVSGGFQKTLFGHVPAYRIPGNGGLLGLAFHPEFKTNRKYYVYYLSGSTQGLLEERFARSSFASDSGSGRAILQSTFGENVHNGGDVHFGPEGYLYLGFGDAGNPNVYNTRAQDLRILPGKMIRIDVNGRQAGLQYAIPADNPFMASPDTLLRKEIWAYGLRQPWRWNFDPLKGTLFVADVGDWVEEEVDTLTKGGNYGWSVREGNTCFNSLTEYQPLPSCDTTGLMAPLHVMTHVPIDVQGNSSLTGGLVFRGDPASGAYGAYISGDFITRKLYATLPESPGVVQKAVIGDAPIGMSTFGSDTLGNIYMVGYGNGVIYRLDHPALTGKVVALAPFPRTRATFQGVSRAGRGWLLDARGLAGIERLQILDLKGKRRLTLHREQWSQPFFLEEGIYFAEGSGPQGRKAFILLLR